MNLSDLATISPLIALALASIVTMLAAGFYRNLVLISVLALAGLLLTLALLPLAASSPTPKVSNLLIVDRFALYYIALIVLASFAVTVLSYGYMKKRTGEREEFFVLLLLATLGAAVLAASNHFVSLFLGLEILSVSLYGLIAYTRRRAQSVEAGMKYLVLASASAAFLLLGIALIYAATGSMEFPRANPLTTATLPSEGWILVGTGLLIVGVGFKLAVVPFHMWTPDVYEGAPAPVTAFVATASKGAVFALLLRYFSAENFSERGGLALLFGLIAVASILAGNLLALFQHNVKRMLAYSSIAHLGYLLVAFLAGGTSATSVASFYLATYFATTLCAFGVVTALSRTEHDADELSDYSALLWQRPFLGIVLIVALISLAGLPLTAGFVGKFYVVLAGAGANLWWLLFALVAGSIVSLFYYLRLTLVILQSQPRPPSLILAPAFTWATKITLAALVAIVIWLGIYPGPLLDIVADLSS